MCLSATVELVEDADVEQEAEEADVDLEIQMEPGLEVDESVGVASMTQLILPATPRVEAEPSYDPASL